MVKTTTGSHHLSISEEVSRGEVQIYISGPESPSVYVKQLWLSERGRVGPIRWEMYLRGQYIYLVEGLVTLWEIGAHMSLHNAEAVQFMTQSKYDEAFLYLSDIPDKDHKALSMLITSALMTLRFEEAKTYLSDYKEYIARYALRSNEISEGYQFFESKIAELNLDSFDLPIYKLGKYAQSCADKHGDYPESRCFQNDLKTKSYHSIFEASKNNLHSDMAEVRTYANFYLGECFFSNKQYMDSYQCYIEAAKNCPTKAVFYGIAAQTLYRAFGVELVSNKKPFNLMGEMAILLRRAINLDYINPQWHYLLANALIFYAPVGSIRPASYEAHGNHLLELAKKECDLAVKFNPSRFDIEVATKTIYKTINDIQRTRE